MAAPSPFNSKPANTMTAGINPSHWLNQRGLMFACPFLGPGMLDDTFDYASRQSVKKISCGGGLGVPGSVWQRVANNASRAAYPGGQNDWVYASGWLDGNQNLLATAPVRTYYVTINTTGQNMTVAYGSGTGSNGTVTSTAGIITAAVFQTALVALTTVGTGNATVTGPNNGPFVVTISTPATWPADLDPVGAANPGLTTWLPSAGLYYQWRPEQLQKMWAIPSTTGCWYRRIFKPASTTTTQGTIRAGDTREGAPFCTYLGSGVTAGNFGVNHNTSSLTNYPLPNGTGDWLDVITSYGNTTVDTWINGVHQTQVTGSSITNQWNNQLLTLPYSREHTINFSMFGSGTTVSTYGSPQGQVNNAGIALDMFGLGQLSVADVARWIEEGVYAFMMPTRTQIPGFG